MMMKNDVLGSYGDDQGLIRVVGHFNRRKKAAITNAIKGFVIWE